MLGSIFSFTPPSSRGARFVYPVARASAWTVETAGERDQTFTWNNSACIAPSATLLTVPVMRIE